MLARDHLRVLVCALAWSRTSGPEYPGTGTHGCAAPPSRSRCHAAQAVVCVFIVTLLRITSAYRVSQRTVERTSNKLMLRSAAPMSMLHVSPPVFAESENQATPERIARLDEQSAFEALAVSTRRRSGEG